MYYDLYKDVKESKKYYIFWKFSAIPNMTHRTYVWQYFQIFHNKLKYYKFLVTSSK